MFNNTKYISFNFVTFNKKAMKKLTLCIGIAMLSINLSAQYSKKDFNQPQLYVPLITLKSTFVVNEIILRSDKYTPEQKSAMTLQIYFTGCAITYLTHVVIKKAKHKNRRKWKR